VLTHLTFIKLTPEPYLRTPIKAIAEYATERNTREAYFYPRKIWHIRRLLLMDLTILEELAYEIVMIYQKALEEQQYGAKQVPPRMDNRYLHHMGWSFKD
jgi:hypothetical protein